MKVQILDEMKRHIRKYKWLKLFQKKQKPKKYWRRITMENNYLQDRQL